MYLQTSAETAEAASHIEAGLEGQSKDEDGQDNPCEVEDQDVADEDVPLTTSQKD